jgi:hypothetical protein
MVGGIGTLHWTFKSLVDALLVRDGTGSDLFTGNSLLLGEDNRNWRSIVRVGVQGTGNWQSLTSARVAFVFECGISASTQTLVDDGCKSSPTFEIVRHT